MPFDPFRNRAAQALLEETAEDLYEHAPGGYISTLPDGTIVKINQTLIEWTQHSRDALLSGTKFQSLLATGLTREGRFSIALRCSTRPTGAGTKGNCCSRGEKRNRSRETRWICSRC